MSKANTTKIVLGCIWAVLAASAGYVWYQAGISLKDLPAALEGWLGRFGIWNAALIYIVIFAIRPLLLFPATILTLVSGAVFGPWLGILFTAIGENLSAAIAFMVARYFGGTWEKDRDTSSLKKWEKRLRDNAIVTVMTLRFLFVHFDLVNYACGVTPMRYRDFFIGTFIGIIPGMTSFVLFGSILTADDGGERGLVIALSLFFFIIGFIVAGVLKRREGKVAPAAA